MIDGTTMPLGHADAFIWGFWQVRGYKGTTTSTRTPFRGFGLTQNVNLNWSTFIAISGVAGAKGSTTQFTLSAGNGLLYQIGARVTVYDNAANLFTSNFNQGSIVARTAGTVDVLLDSDARYGAALVLGSTGLIKKWSAKPIDAAGDLFSGFDYKLLGMIRTDDNGDFQVHRYPGDPYWLEPPLVIHDQTVGSTTSFLFSGVRHGPLETECMAIWGTTWGQNSAYNCKLIGYPEGTQKFQFYTSGTARVVSNLSAPPPGLIEGPPNPILSPGGNSHRGGSAGNIGWIDLNRFTYSIGVDQIKEAANNSRAYIYYSAFHAPSLEF